jgi:hypothetical protein
MVWDELVRQRVDATLALDRVVPFRVTDPDADDDPDDTPLYESEEDEE